MNIGIEATKTHHKDGGFGVYPRKLMKNMLSLDNENQYFIFTSERIEGLNEFANCSQILVPKSDGIANFLRHFFMFKYIVKRQKIDILHLLSLYGIYQSPSVTISTVFDLRHLAVSELKERKFGKEIYRYVLPFLLKKSNHLISISEETRDCLTKYCNIPGKKITTIPLGHEMVINTVDFIQNKLPEKYFLWVGMITKRKNLETLYKAYYCFMKNTSYHEVGLVIVGNFLNSKIETEHSKLINTLGIANKISFLGYIPNDKISYLFRNALAFIFPSIYEGFGIPIIEAMAVGAPVITTIDGGATREVAGDTALLFRKYDYEVLAIKMAEIIENNELRQRLIAGGKERAKLYTWKRTAELTLDLY